MHGSHRNRRVRTADNISDMGIHNFNMRWGSGLATWKTVILGMLMLCAENAMASPDDDQALPSNNSVTFLGFSANETVTAWRVQVSQPQANGVTDRFTVIHVVDANTNALKATFRGSSGISRSRTAGTGRTSVSTATLLQDNPKFAKALPYSEWQRFSRKAHWWKKLVPMNDPQIRLLADDDMRADLKAGDECIGVITKPGSPMGYQPMAFLVDGQMVSLGHFRKEARGNLPMRACVEVYRSHSAFHVAVLHRFEVATGPNSKTYRSEPMGVVVKLDEILGHSTVGTINLMRANLRVGEKLFKAEHPNSGDLYHKLVGTYW